MSYARRKELREKHRAIVAEAPAAPYAETFRGLTVTVRFDASKACARRQ